MRSITLSNVEPSLPPPQAFPWPSKRGFWCERGDRERAWSASEKIGSERRAQAVGDGILPFPSLPSSPAFLNNFNENIPQMSDRERLGTRNCPVPGAKERNLQKRPGS